MFLIDVSIGLIASEILFKLVSFLVFLPLSARIQAWFPSVKEKFIYEEGHFIAYDIQ